MKSMKIDEIAASWDRAKVSIGATGRTLGFPTGRQTFSGEMKLKLLFPEPEIHEIS